MPWPASVARMWRLFVALGTVGFSLGALAGAVLLVLLVADGDFRPVLPVAFGTACFAWGAWACRRDWQRARQEREFRQSVSRDDRG